MEEKVIIKSEHYNLRKVFMVFLLIGIAAFVILYFVFCQHEAEFCLSLYKPGGVWSSPLHAYLDGAFSYFMWFPAGAFFGICLVGLIWCTWFKGCEMVVTDKRVYGKVVGGKRVDLPMDSVSSVGMCFPKAVAVATASGRMVFAFVKNEDEVHGEISKLLLARQYKKVEVQQIVTQDNNKSEMDELKKCKELLDAGVITQEEFDAKKKQLLGL